MTTRMRVGVALAVAGVAAATLLLVNPFDEGPSGRSGTQAPLGLAGVVDGFRFEVVNGDCGYASVVTATETILAERGVFCLVRFNLTHEGEQARRLDPSCQYLIDRSGTRHGQREDVLGFDETSRMAFERPVGPGEYIEDAALYYDVAKGTKAAAVEMHASCTGTGVRLRVDPPPEG